MIEAASARLRPMLMTTLATLLGTLPIALALGAGSESRVPMGIAILGGLTVGTALTLYVVPAVYTYVTSKKMRSVDLRRRGRCGGVSECGRLGAARRIGAALAVASLAVAALLLTAPALAHPGSGIGVDRQGRIFFVDTGEGVWVVETDGRVRAHDGPAFHWMTLDPASAFGERAASRTCRRATCAPWAAIRW